VSPSKYLINKLKPTFLRSSWKNATTSETDKVIKAQGLNTQLSMTKSP